jgi:hypothetical protein
VLEKEVMMGDCFDLLVRTVLNNVVLDGKLYGERRYDSVDKKSYDDDRKMSVYFGAVVYNSNARPQLRLSMMHSGTWCPSQNPVVYYSLKTHSRVACKR